MRTLTAHLCLHTGATCVRTTAWSVTSEPTFAEAMALVRRHVGAHSQFPTSQPDTDLMKLPRALFERFIDVVCSAASCG